MKTLKANHNITILVKTLPIAEFAIKIKTTRRVCIVINYFEKNCCDLLINLYLVVSY